MLLRICLIVAVVTTIGALGVSFKVRGNINKLSDDLETTTRQRDDAQAAQRQAQNDARAAKAELEETFAKLSEVESRLDTAVADARVQTQRANELNSRLIDVTEQRNQAQRELARWSQVGASVEQVLAMKTDLEETIEARNALEEENGFLNRQVQTLQARINILTVPDYEVKLPDTIAGKVTAVDPKYNFVVLNIGRDSQLLEDAKLAVSREGRLIGKVRITSLEQNRAIANILPGWDLGDIHEGDDVLASYEAISRN